MATDEERSVVYLALLAYSVNEHTYENAMEQLDKIIDVIDAARTSGYEQGKAEGQESMYRINEEVMGGNPEVYKCRTFDVCRSYVPAPDSLCLYCQEAIVSVRPPISQVETKPYADCAWCGGAGIMRVDDHELACACKSARLSDAHKGTEEYFCYYCRNRHTWAQGCRPSEVNNASKGDAHDEGDASGG